MIETFSHLVHPGSDEEALLNQLDLSRMPTHVSVIMDGNGRWAKARGLKRVEGHQRGAETARMITEYSVRLGLEYLTLFAFSSENWKRPITEVNTLMNMLYQNLVSQEKLIMDNAIQFRVIGRMGDLPGKLRKKIEEMCAKSISNRGMTLCLALNYGGRTEIVDAVRRVIRDDLDPGKMDETLFGRYLYTADCPDPDLVIRTSGEKRISNFLLYQIAYSELVFSEVLWPEFRLREYLHALLEFQGRQRRYGRI